MDEKKQIEHFANDLDNLVERYRKEYQISYAAIIGTLILKAHFVSDEAGEATDE